MNPIHELAIRSASLASCRVLGIDLGTTNSTVAEIKLPLDPAGNAESLCECLSPEQMTHSGPYYGSLVPSVVAIDAANKVWIGEGAKRMRSLPKNYNLSPGKNLFQDTKNDMGLRKRYFRAPEEFDHARKVAGHILRFLAQGARQASGHPFGRTVVTVPASFQLNQRNDTLEATRLAGLYISDYDLLDEPVAAFTDYLFTHAAPDLFTRPANVVVFDFGGGTCDVFLARIIPREGGGGLDIVARSVSRYHRLGGFDLDAAIIHEVLIPALLKENNLGPRHFEWGDRKQLLEPALRGCAEALKEGLCREIAQLHLHGVYQSSDKADVAARQMSTPVKAGGREYVLTQPILTAARWEELLEPFLGTEFLHVRQSDYRQTLSIFAPLTDAIERARIPKDDIDFVLLAGGSSLIPQVRWAIEGYFPDAEVLSFPDSTSAQTAIARGAAWNAAWLEATGEPFVRPVTSEAVALRVRGREPITLVEACSPIPYPAGDAWATKPGFVVPRDFRGRLGVTIITIPDEQTVLHVHLDLDKKHAGEPLQIRYRFSACRSFECEVALQRDPGQSVMSTVENPLVNIANPGEARVEIEEIEEELRDTSPLGARHRQKLLRLASLYREIRMPEKAAEVLKTTSRVVGQPDEHILNLQGLTYEEVGDYNRMEACYREAVKAGTWAGPYFNWALHCYRHQRHEEALEKADEAIVRAPDQGPYRALRARLLAATGQGEAAVEAARLALGMFPPAKNQSDWELGWYESAAKIVGDEKLLRDARDAREAQTKRANTGDGGSQEPDYVG